MISIMQGTTPTLTIAIRDSDFLLADVSEIDLKIRNGINTKSYSKSDLSIDTMNNTLSKFFSEEETIALNPKYSIVVQGRFWFPDGGIVGINKISLSVADMLGVGSDG